MPSTLEQARAALVRMDRQLEARRVAIDLWESYYEGEHRLLFATSKYREVFGTLFKEFSSNWCEIVVDAPVERLTVEGFRIGANEGADAAATALWQANDLDGESVIGHTDAGKCGEAYVMVEPGRDGGMPTITVEHPAQVIVEAVPGNPRLRGAGLKKWPADDGSTWANVYFADAVWKFRRRGDAHLATQSSTDIALWLPNAARTELETWQLREDEPTPNRLGYVPIIPLSNKVSRRGGRRRGRSDIASVVPLQDMVNKVLLDAVVASEFGAFAQRWATGIEPEIDEDTGEELPGSVDPSRFVAGADRMWLEGNPDAKFGAFPAVDLGPYVKLVATAVQHIAAQTRTPPHYLLAEMVNVSGDALKAAETGLVSKARLKTVSFGGTWEEVVRLAFLSSNDGDIRKLGNEAKIETIWRDVETRTEGERVDAAVKLKDLLPERAIWRRLGYSEIEMDRFAKWRAEQDVTALSSVLGGGPGAGA